ncbi:hypothetical protein, partial [Arthrobacter sp. UNC362MFTsu5.1]|uniref:hypothetical protein n=1 Tax=Arthrobacter sp. UNC362MFTsu5.1 TaxID=1449044 RepID=UPI0005BC5880
MRSFRSRFVALLMVTAGVVSGSGLAMISPAAASSIDNTEVHTSPATAFVSESFIPTVAGTFTSLTPFRQLDTRNGTGGISGAVAPWATIRVKVTGRGGIPAAGVSAVSVNVTVTSPGTAGNITVYAGGTNQPGTSNLNFTSGQTIPNLVNSPVGTDGTIALTNNSGSTV